MCHPGTGSCRSSTTLDTTSPSPRNEARARAAQRQRLLDAIAAADNALDHVAAATAPDRDVYASAAARADDARRHLAAVHRRLDTARRRARRSLRDELDVAERRLERAAAYLERTRQRTEPSIEQYRLAQAQRRDAHDNLRHRNTADLLDAMRYPVDVHRQRVAAFDTWQRWAKGHDVGKNDLLAAVDTLNTMDGSDRPLAEALAGSLEQWAIHNHVDLTAHASPAPAIQPAAIEIEL